MKGKIVVVEDDPEILDLMELLLKNLGYEPVLISNGLDALKHIQQEVPVLVLLDIIMSPISGWEFLDQLRNNLGLKDLPVILFTAAPTILDQMEKINDPHICVLQKPASLADLKKAIGSFGI